MASTNENDREKIVQLEKCFDDLKNLYEYENKEAFVLNFNLFNDNVILNETLKQVETENESLLAKCDALKDENKTINTRLEALTLENLTLRKELNKIRNDLIDHKRSQSVPKRLNTTLNASFSKKKNDHNSSNDSKTSSNKHLDRSFDSSSKSYKSYGHSNVVYFNDIKIKGICSSEKSICLVNTTKRAIEIGAWRIRALVDGVEMLDYRFMSNAFMWPYQEIKLWSASATKKKDNNLNDFIIKSTDKQYVEHASLWSYNYNLLDLTLYDKNNNVMSRMESNSRSMI